MAEKQAELERKVPVTRLEPLRETGSPFQMLQRFADEMECSMTSALADDGCYLA
jgi:hypothetical protein